MKELEKTYDHSKVEQKIYQKWLDSGYFNPDMLPNAKDREPFTIALPPPNVTGVLHMGHAFEDTIQDVIIRYQRMRGRRALWLPGTDHAAIATQAKFEKELYKKEKKSRHDFSREEFFRMIQKFALSNQQGILSQLHKLGLSMDWSRLAFTLDKQREKAVRTAFKKMYEAGLIYRGKRMVNWDPKAQTTVSDDEIEYVEQKDLFYHFKYGPFDIATVRPETKFGDKYVVMHPKDKRYKKYKHGQKIELEWINGPITATIIKDEAADMEFGSGAMTITPAHSAIDFEIAQRHGLDIDRVIDDRGVLLPIAGEFAGIHIKKARLEIVEKLRKKGLVTKIEENYVHNVATNMRGGGIIEPQIKLQWFIDVNKKFTLKNSKISGIPAGEKTTLKDVMRKTVESGQIKIMPERFEKIYFHWIDNLRDWCISRQIVYGHRIPVWYRGDEIHCDINSPKGEGWLQDTDTLDTWFSSGLWTFSTLGWPDETADLKTYHPTSVMIPGYEILFFWVARMILMSGFLLGDIPFRQVVLHGMVRDKLGRKFSKSLDNGVDPLDMTAKYGTDALRMALIFGSGPGNDVAFDEQRVKGMKHFANKLWNISRYVMTNTENAPVGAGFSRPQYDDGRASAAPTTDADKNILDKLDSVIKSVTNNLENYRLHEAAQEIYQFTWHEFADVYIEASKNQLKDEKLFEQTLYTLHFTLLTILKLLHPFMPFVTEEIWSKLGQKDLLLIVEWPK
ncbi:MAG: valine--tRNA ligase [Patescibacteria group bacterium]